MKLVHARAEAVPRRRHRVALMLVLIAAAMPTRVTTTGSFFGSVSILDILLCLVAVTLVMDCAFRPLDIGYPKLFALLSVPVVICAISVTWSGDKGETARSTIVYAEGIVAYLFVQRELAGASPSDVMKYMKRYAYMVIVPAVLLLLHVPGFHPEEADLDPESSRFLTYYTRLSHPALGPSNNLATVLSFFVPILLYWGHVKSDARITRAGFVGLIAVAFTLSRGVGLALLVAGLLGVMGNFVREYRISGRIMGKIAIAAAALSLSLMLFYHLNRATHDFFLTRFSSDNSTLRFNFAAEAIPKIMERPVLGFGGGVAPVLSVPLGRVHNTYIQQVLNYGLFFGLIVSLALVGTAIFFFSRWRTSGVARAVGFALIAQLVIFAVESSFEGTTLRVLFYLSIGLAAAMVRATEEQQLPMNAESETVLAGKATQDSG